MAPDEADANEEDAHEVPHLTDLVLAVTADLAAAEGPDVDAGIRRALERVAQATSVQRARVFEVAPDREIFSCTHEWIDPASDVAPGAARELPTAWMAPWWSALERGEAVAIDRIETFPPQAAPLRAMLAAQHVHSLVWLPMPGTPLPGFVCFASTRTPRAWADEESHLLRATTNVVRASLARKRSSSERDLERERLRRDAAFRRDLITLTNDLMRARSQTEAIPDLFEHAIGLVPGAGGGAVLLRRSDGAFRAEASVGYDLPILEPHAWDLRELMPSPTAASHHAGPATPPESWRPTHAAAWEAARAGPTPRATLVTPVQVAGTVRAVLLLDMAVEEEACDADEAESYAAAVAAQLAAAIRQWDLIAALRTERERLEYQAAHDALTGLANRRAFTERLDQALARARRHGERVGVAFLDLDDFKHVNDALGHHAGDRLLAEVASRLHQTVRAEDTVARLGGDEFGIVVGDLASDDALERLQAKLHRVLDDPIVLQGRATHVTASVGAAEFPRHGSIGDALLRAADAAMYDAKRAR
ncbi:MAG: sensor domain-containing diguanylate cyclase [Trueperaceae bacterium]|nr:sensor domain-containing diguanylate cyclase [Trueperaceae bacterium]